MATRVMVAGEVWVRMANEKFSLRMGGCGGRVQCDFFSGREGGG